MNKKLALAIFGGVLAVTLLLAGVVFLNRDRFLSRLAAPGPRPVSQAGSHSASPASRTGTDTVDKAIQAYRYSTRMAYNGRRFDELERLADEARSSKAKFGNGSWKIYQFYDSLGCDSSEPEGMWQLHDTIHKDWVAAKPDSITARTAQIVFLVEYAWRARGNGYADTVTAEGGRVFDERLKMAHQALDGSRNLSGKCPVWWSAGMRLALGESWPRDVYDRFYAEAKRLEPGFWNYDTSRSNFLALKWYGGPGEWEQAAETAADDPNGLGLEVYARCVLYQRSNYRNIFRESKASWPKTKEGFELMRQRYPESLELASAYCRMACIAEDRATAKQLFDRLGGNVFSYIWSNRELLESDRAWANGER